MTIILEGGDKVGKSTTCEFLKLYDCSYFHFDYPKTSDVYGIYIDYFKNSSRSKTDMLFDRAMYSEYVYSRYYKRPSSMTIDKIHELENMFKNHSSDGKTAILYLENNVYENLDLLKKENEGKITTIDQILDLRQTYYEVLKESTLPVFTYNYNCQNLETVLTSINNYFNRG